MKLPSLYKLNLEACSLPSWIEQLDKSIADTRIEYLSLASNGLDFLLFKRMAIQINKSKIPIKKLAIHNNWMSF